MNKFFSDVEKFMTIAGQLDEKRNFDVRQIALYIGLQLEEIAEKLEACGFNPASPAVHLLNYTSGEFKRGVFDHLVSRANREDLLDADIDLAWVTIGSALSQGANVQGAANLEKFPNGVAIRDDNGKVVKPSEWKEPDLKPFVKGK